MNEESILVSVKREAGLTEDYDVFDPNLIMHINTALFRLRQIGIGPKAPFTITGYDETWSDLLGDKADKYTAVCTYIAFRVRKMFDAPASTNVMSALDSTIAEMEWCLNVEFEEENTDA